MTEQLIICTICLAILFALALFIALETSNWAEVSPLSSLLALAAIPAALAAVAILLQPLSAVSLLAGLLLLISLFALVAALSFRWARALAVFSGAALFLIVPSIAWAAL